MIIHILISLFLICDGTSQTVSAEVELFIDSLHMFVQTSNKGYSFLLFAINTEAEYTYLENYAFKDKAGESTQSVKTIVFDLNSTEFKGIEYKDKIKIAQAESYFNYTIIDDFHFIVLDDNELIFVSSSLSFALRPKDETYSLVHLLKKQNVINKKQFSLYSNRTGIKGQIFFGDVNHAIIETNNYVFTTELKVKGDKNVWDVQFSHIFIGDIKNKNYLSNSNGAYISTTTKYIQVPLNDFEFIVEKYVQKLLDDKDCAIDPYGRHSISCQCEAKDKMGNITLIIQGHKYVFNGGDLLYKSTELCTFGIIVNEKSYDWILGVTFLWKYYTAFDYENSKIVIYSQEPLEEYKVKNVILINCMMYIANTFICIGLIVLGIYLIMNRKKDMNYNYYKEIFTNI